MHPADYKPPVAEMNLGELLDALELIGGWTWTKLARALRKTEIFRKCKVSHIAEGIASLGCEDWDSWTIESPAWPSFSKELAGLILKVACEISSPPLHFPDVFMSYLGETDELNFRVAGPPIDQDGFHYGFFVHRVRRGLTPSRSPDFLGRDELLAVENRYVGFPRRN